jgi:hypothetical protein
MQLINPLIQFLRFPGPTKSTNFQRKSSHGDTRREKYEDLAQDKVVVDR